jgi:tRNA threonylcarbamoyladenosine biosynthesis protein TsaB
MLVLALDSTTRAGSVALVDDRGVIAERAGDGALTHAERLPRELIALLDAHHLALPAIDLFAVASGPGSFTGLRIGIATMQGLALVEGRPLVGIPALEALAQHGAAGRSDGAITAAWMDGYRRDVFTALYRAVAAPGRSATALDVLDPPAVDGPEATLEGWRARGWHPAVFTGDGAALYRDRIAAADPAATILAAPPLAGIIGRLALARAEAGERPHPAALQPLYVRRPDAETARDARAAVGKPAGA